jgi:hypothetical protein
LKRSPDGQFCCPHVLGEIYLAAVHELLYTSRENKGNHPMIVTCFPVE